MPRAIKKSDLPTKTCPACGRPFAWRRKWAKDWPQVVYCSERCRRHRGGPMQSSSAQGFTAPPVKA